MSGPDLQILFKVSLRALVVIPDAPSAVRAPMLYAQANVAFRRKVPALRYAWPG